GIRDFHVTGVQTCALPIYGEPVGMAGVCADVTDRKRVEWILKDQLHALAIVYRLSSEIAMARDEAQVLKSAVRAASDLADADKVDRKSVVEGQSGETGVRT